MVAALAFGAALLLCAGCARRSAEVASHSGLIVAVTAEPQSLDPLLIEGQPTALVVPTVFDFLVTANERGELVPDLATAVPSTTNGGISRDGLTITYHLRKGVRWQDGAPLTAEDVVFTYSAVMNPNNNVLSREGFDVVRSITAVDEVTVRVTLKRRFSPIVATLFGPDQNYPILPKHLLARYSSVNQIPFNTTPVGSGPYRALWWRRSEAVGLDANTRYFGGDPRIKHLTWKFIPDNSTVLQQLRTHEIDAAFYADPAYLQQYRAIPGMVVARTPISGTAALFFNTEDPEMRDVRVRRAIVEAIDIPRLVRDATRGNETSDNAAAGLFSWAFDPAVKLPSQNLADAKALLKASGRRAITLHFILESGDAEGEQVGVALQQELRPLGINVVLRQYTPVEYMAPAESGGPIFGGHFQLAFLQFLTGTDPNQLAIFGCSEVAPRGFNLTRFCDPAIENAFQADAQNYDHAARLRYLSIVQQQLAQTLPFVPLWHRRAISVYPQWLNGVNPSPISPYWNIASWSIRE